MRKSTHFVTLVWSLATAINLWACPEPTVKWLPNPVCVFCDSKVKLGEDKGPCASCEITENAKLDNAFTKEDGAKAPVATGAYDGKKIIKWNTPGYCIIVSDASLEYECTDANGDHFTHGESKPSEKTIEQKQTVGKMGAFSIWPEGDTASAKTDTTDSQASPAVADATLYLGESAEGKAVMVMNLAIIPAKCERFKWEMSAKKKGGNAKKGGWDKTAGVFKGDLVTLKWTRPEPGSKPKPAREFEIKVSCGCDGCPHLRMLYVTIVRADIEEPDGLPIQTVTARDSRFRLNPSCFEWQFVHVDNEVVAYHATQPIDGLVEPIPPSSYNWSVSKGTLNDATTETPTYVPDGTPVPNTMTTVDLEIRPIPGSDASLQTRSLEVYRDHLERDYQNWGTGIDCGADTYVYYWQYSRYGQNWKLLHSWNCFGSVWHAYNGTKHGYTTTVPSSGFAVTTYDNPVPWSTAVANLRRGDFVSFYTYDSATESEVLQHAHTCLGSSSQMYGANNEPVYGYYSRNDGYGHSAIWEGGSWRWWATSSETYYNQLNAAYQSIHPGAGKLINRIKVHRKTP